MPTYPYMRLSKKRPEEKEIRSFWSFNSDGHDFNLSEEVEIEEIVGKNDPSKFISRFVPIDQVAETDAVIEPSFVEMNDDTDLSGDIQPVIVGSAPLQEENPISLKLIVAGHRGNHLVAACCFSDEKKVMLVADDTFLSQTRKNLIEEMFDNTRRLESFTRFPATRKR